MNIEYVNNSRMRVWIITSTSHVYCTRTAAFRAMFENNKVRVIVYESLTENPTEESDLLNHCNDGISLLITYVKVGDPSRFVNNKWYLTLLNCSVIRSWIPKPVAMQYADVQNLNFFVEIESLDYTWNKEIT